MNKHPEWIYSNKFGRYTYATDGQTGIYVKKDNEDWKITAKIAKNSYLNKDLLAVLKFKNGCWTSNEKRIVYNERNVRRFCIDFIKENIMVYNTYPEIYEDENLEKDAQEINF